MNVDGDNGAARPERVYAFSVVQRCGFYRLPISSTCHPTIPRLLTTTFSTACHRYAACVHHLTARCAAPRYLPTYHCLLHATRNVNDDAICDEQPDV